jgi:hypothetical protein
MYDMLLLNQGTRVLGILSARRSTVEQPATTTILQ